MSKPIHSIRFSGVEAAIWENDGRLHATYQKSYKDKEGNWKQTTFFSSFDNAALLYVAHQAITYMEARRQANYKAPSSSAGTAVTPAASFGDDDVPF